MKNKIFIPVLLLITVSFFACKKKYDVYAAPFTTDLSNSAFIKVVDVTIGANRNYVYLDNTQTPLTGATLGTLTSSATFPATVTYAAIAPGSRTLIVKDTLSTSTQKVVSASGTFSAGNYYTLFTYDTTTNAKFNLVQDDIQVPGDTTTARVRFANMIFSSSALPNVDVYSTRVGSNVFTNIPIGQVTNFASWPASSYAKVVDTLYIRQTGTTTNLVQINSFTPTSQRSYTVVYAGRYQSTSGTLSVSNPLRTAFILTNK